MVFARHPELGQQVPSRWTRSRTVPAYKRHPTYDSAPWEVTELAEITTPATPASAAAVESSNQSDHRGEGIMYQALGPLDIVEIAKRTRVNLKNAQAVGMLPAEATFSVTTHRYSMGQSLTVTIKNMPDHWTYTTEPDEFGHDRRVYSPAARAALAAVTDFVEAYNRDRADTTTDYHNVWFSSSVNIEDEDTATFRAAEKARKATRKRDPRSPNTGDQR